MAHTDATAEEAEAVVDAIEAEADERHTKYGTRKVGQIDAYVAQFSARDLNRHLRSVRAQRAPQARTAGPARGQCTVPAHAGNSLPCGPCRAGLNIGGEDAEPVLALYRSLGPDAAALRPDLASHPKVAALASTP